MEILGKRIERILCFNEVVDMRNNFDGLTGIVKRELKEDPLNGTFFVFMNRRGDYLKGLYWDRTGYCLFSKRLMRGRFRLPSNDRTQELDCKLFLLLLDGLVIAK